MNIWWALLLSWGCICAGFLFGAAWSMHFGQVKAMERHFKKRDRP